MSSEFVRCPVQQFDLKVVGENITHIVDTIENPGAINLIHIETIAIEEVQLIKELVEGVTVTFDLYQVVLIRANKEEPFIWILPNRETAIIVGEAFLKGGDYVNKRKLKEVEPVYGLVEVPDEGTGGTD